MYVNYLHIIHTTVSITEKNTHIYTTPPPLEISETQKKITSSRPQRGRNSLQKTRTVTANHRHRVPPPFALRRRPNPNSNPPAAATAPAAVPRPQLRLGAARVGQNPHRGWTLGGLGDEADVSQGVLRFYRERVSQRQGLEVRLNLLRLPIEANVGVRVGGGGWGG